MVVPAAVKLIEKGTGSEGEREREWRRSRCEGAWRKAEREATREREREPAVVVDGGAWQCVAAVFTSGPDKTPRWRIRAVRGVVISLRRWWCWNPPLAAVCGGPTDGSYTGQVMVRGLVRVLVRVGLTQFRSGSAVGRNGKRQCGFCLGTGFGLDSNEIRVLRFTRSRFGSVYV
ncbi:hypothetical protein Hanom_Chr09g00759601 [Helianthus anomalus]